MCCRYSYYKFVRIFGWHFLCICWLGKKITYTVTYPYFYCAVITECLSKHNIWLCKPVPTGTFLMKMWRQMLEINTLSWDKNLLIYSPYGSHLLVNFQNVFFFLPNLLFCVCVSTCACIKKKERKKGGLSTEPVIICLFDRKQKDSPQLCVFHRIFSCCFFFFKFLFWMYYKQVRNILYHSRSIQQTCCYMVACELAMLAKQQSLFWLGSKTVSLSFKKVGIKALLPKVLEAVTVALWQTGLDFALQEEK